MTVPKVEMRNVSKTFIGNGRQIKALHNVSISVEDGEFITIIGPSGSGKSTLFNLIVGLLEPDEGEICFDGDICHDRRSRAGYMPQRDLLLPWRNIIDNVILPQEVQGTSRDAAHERALELLPLFGLEEFANAYPHALSGGMRQRAALLRTILADKDVMLLDEPFGALDALTRKELQDWLLGLWRKFNQTVIFITHDVDEALYLGDRVIVLSPRPGTVIKSNKVELPRPRRQGMVGWAEFGAQVTDLLSSLGVAT